MPKISPRKKNGSEITIATQYNKKKLHSVEEESLLMQCHSLNIEKIAKAN